MNYKIILILIISLQLAFSKPLETSKDAFGKEFCDEAKVPGQENKVYREKMLQSLFLDQPTNVDDNQLDQLKFYETSKDIQTKDNDAVNPMPYKFSMMTDEFRTKLKVVKAWFKEKKQSHMGNKNQREDKGINGNTIN